jgi:hypothetical protein
VAILAIDIRLDRAFIADFNIRDTRSHGNHFHAKFVAWDPWIAEEWHFAEIAGKVRAADSDLMDPNHGIAGPWGRRFGDVDQPPVFGRIE